MAHVSSFPIPRPPPLFSATPERDDIAALYDAVAQPALPRARTDLRRARELAGLSRGELAARLGEPVDVVKRTETGKTIARPPYVARVLAACGLPDDWEP